MKTLSKLFAMSALASASLTAAYDDPHPLVDNILFLAPEQYTVTATGATLTNLGMLFDGKFKPEDSFNGGETLVLSIDLTPRYGTEGIDRNSGVLYLTFTDGKGPASLEAELAEDGTATSNSFLTAVNEGNGLWSLTTASEYDKVTSIELTIVMEDDSVNSGEVTELLEIEYIPDFAYGDDLQWSAFTKHQDQFLYRDITFLDSSRTLSIKLEAETGKITARELDVDGYVFNGANNSIIFENYVGSGSASVVVDDNPVLQFQNHSSIDQEDGNIALGYLTDLSATTGDNNLILGNRAMNSNVTGRLNVAIGYKSLQQSDAVDDNIAIGTQAMYLSEGAKHNIAIGGLSLSNFDDDYAIGIGQGALRYREDTGFLIAIGTSAMGYSGLGSDPGPGTATLTPASIWGSMALGYQSLMYLNDGHANTAVGHQSGFKLTSGTINSYFGKDAGLNLLTGTGNTFLGANAARDITSGSGNIAIGSQTVMPDPTGDDQLNIGNTIYGDLDTGEVGIGVTDPEAKLHVVGSTKLDGDVEVTGALVLSAPSGDIPSFGE